MNHDPKLEDQIQRALQGLPELSAPETLAPRVLAAIRAQSARPWWQQSWAAWPRPIQTAAIASLAFVAVALSLAGGWAWQAASRPDVAGHWFDTLPAWGDTLLNTSALLFRHAGTNWLVLGLAAVILMYLTCVGVGTLCFRLVISKR